MYGEEYMIHPNYVLRLPSFEIPDSKISKRGKSGRKAA